MARHARSTIWPLRMAGELRRRPESARNGHVRTLSRSEVEIALYSDGVPEWPIVRRPGRPGGAAIAVTLDRRTAELLCRRLRACLDDTR